MTPLYLNLPSSSPFPLPKDDHDLDHHHHQDHKLHLFMINSPPSSQTHDLTQTHFKDHHLQHDHQHKVEEGKNKLSTHKQLQDPEEIHMSTETESNGSAKWMSSKVRLMRKMISSDCSAARDDTDADDDKSTTMRITRDHQQQQNVNSTRRTSNSIDLSNNNSTVRVCSDCNTTTTPLWRSGPRGPKSLCNACGIRQRKARRAMAEAANRAVGADQAAIKTGTYNKVQNKDKKPRTGLVATIKKQCKTQETVASSSSSSQKKLCFKDFALSLSNNSTFQRVFPKDEEEAAILLMELSCGLVHS